MPSGARRERGAWRSWSDRRVAGILAFVLVVLTVAPVRGEPNYPSFSAPVVDAAHVLTEADKDKITRKVLDLQQKTGVQFAVATVPTLDGLEIEPYANGLFRAWKIGAKGVNNGLLLILAPNERKLRFEVGYGLEGAFTDLQSKLILNNTMVPKLKAGDPAGALTAGVDDAILVLTKDKADLPARLQPSAAQGDPSGNLVFGLIVVTIFFLIFFSIFRAARRRGRVRWGPAATGGFIGGSMGDSSFGSDSSSSGGDTFSGGGGGDAGGGGASDSY